MSTTTVLRNDDYWVLLDIVVTGPGAPHQLIASSVSVQKFVLTPHMSNTGFILVAPSSLVNCTSGIGIIVSNSFASAPIQPGGSEDLSEWWVDGSADATRLIVLGRKET